MTTGLMMMVQVVVFVGVVCVVFIRGVDSLKDVRINIPPAVILGHNAVLRCHYDLEGDQLYSVKWYKGRREFYRYTPKEQPPQKTFPIARLHVRSDFSNGTHLMLENVNLDNNGEYSCEISADAPSFFTRIVTGTLTVVDLPVQDPAINGLKLRYKLGETIHANCTSGASTPAANLTWYVNGKKIEANVQHTNKRTATSYVYLKLSVAKHLFTKRRMKVRCVASIYDVYYRSSEKSVELEKKHHHHHRHQVTEVVDRDFEANDAIWEYETQAVQRQDGHYHNHHYNYSLTFTPLNNRGLHANAADRLECNFWIIFGTSGVYFINKR